MLTFAGGSRKFCDGLSRRNFIQVGALGMGGLTLANVLQADAARAQEGSAGSRMKSVIHIYLPGGPTHMDTYDLKPEAAAEFRGEFKPIRTNVPGMEICELMPMQAKIADKLAFVRGVRTIDDHSAIHMMTGYSRRDMRPAFGSVVSRVQGSPNSLPPYVSLMNRMEDEQPQYVGAAHRPFVPSGPGMANLSLVSGVSMDRLSDRKTLLGTFDNMRREMDAGGAMTGMDGFNARALDMVVSPTTRQAFDVSMESEKTRAKYGKNHTSFLQARRLVEAGVRVVTLSTGGWDTHGDNFKSMRNQLPSLDQSLHALITDLHERGLGEDVLVMMWGEFGRTPRINSGAGRDHWSYAGFCLMAGGGLKMGQVVGETDARGERAKGTPITAPNVLSTVYHSMGIDPGKTIIGNTGRPMYILDERDPIAELV